MFGIFLDGHVGAIGSPQSVDDDHIVLDKRGGHIGGDGTDAVYVQRVLGGQSADTHACCYFHNNSPLFFYLLTDIIEDERTFLLQSGKRAQSQF